MNGIMIVMLIWSGGTYGGPATIQGFESIKACEMAASTVAAFYNGWLLPMTYKCVELKP